MAFNRKAFALSLVSVVTVLTIAGATAGTLSWYAYTQSASLSFIGTSIKKSLLLNVGLVNDDGYLSDSDIDEFSLVKETVWDGETSHKIVWTSSSNGFDYEVLKTYLEHSPYSLNKLSPVSSHSRTLEDSSPFKLYKAPEYGVTQIDELARQREYVVFPLAFKIVNSNNTYMKDHDIWLTDATVKVADGEHIDQGVRLFVKNQQRQYIVKPSDKTKSIGSTKMGGMLNLSGDEDVYDYDYNTNREYLYGEYENAPVYGAQTYEQAWTPAQLDEYDNVNGTSFTSEGSTFYAKHRKKNYVMDISGCNIAETAHYAFGKVKPAINDTDGSYCTDSSGNGIPFATTDHNSGIALATLTVYLEGWDFSVIDKEIGHYFNLGLTFEVNRT